MNRSEFAALISSTMAAPQHSSTAVRPHRPAPHQHSHPHLPLRNAQRRQSHTPGRRHGSARQAQSEADANPLPPSESRTTRPHSEARSEHGRSYSYLPQGKSPQITTPPVEHGVRPRRMRKSMVAEFEEPDFVRQEREAWSNKSPKTERDINALSQPPSYGRATRAFHPSPDIILQPPRTNRDLPPQPRKQSKQTLPLREFAPIQQETGVEERPKTSRGPNSFSEDEVSLRSSEDSQAGTSMQQTTRRSRFLEGSLNERSAAVASSWYDHDVSEDSYDSDATPRTSKDTRGSSSFDSTDSKTLSITPATIKRKKLFKLKSSVKSGEDVEPIIDQEMPRKRGLRKSISTWNFNLGDKMKIFGGSTNDLTPRPSKPSKGQQKFAKTSVGDSAKDVLDERKRKAEEAYSQQFVLKKQKSNAGIANPTPSSAAPLPNKSSFLKRRTPSSSSRTSSVSYRDRIASADASQSFASDHSASDIDHGKRPSRKELEKENQHLRHLLRQSSSMYFEPHHSSVHLPIGDTLASDDISRVSQENLAQGQKMRILPGKRNGRRGEDVPPVPKLSRDVLGSLENGWHTRANNDRKRLLPRPVSMIVEEEECKEASNLETEKQQMHVSPVKEQWEWPDDVF